MFEKLKTFPLCYHKTTITLLKAYIYNVNGFQPSKRQQHLLRMS